MEDKLTLTIDRGGIAGALALAGWQGTSLSRIVETQLKRLGTELYVTSLRRL